MNTRIGDGPSIQPSIQSTIVTGAEDKKTGQGALGNTGQVGDAGPNMGAVVMALAAFLPAVTGNFEARLAEITGKLKEVSGEVNKDRVLNEQENKRLNMKENQAKIEESEKKLAEAEAKEKSGNIWEKIGMAFQALGAILMMAIGAALIATGAGAGAGAALIIAGGFMLAAMINSVVQQETGAGILGNIAKAAGADEETIMALDIAFTVAMVVGAIVATVASGGAASMGLAATIASAAAQIGSGAATVASSAHNIDAAYDRHDAQQLQADTKDIEAFMQQLDALIDMALAMLMDSSQRFNAVMDSVSDMTKETGDTMSNTRFAV